jgi:hypothetical protein
MELAGAPPDPSEGAWLGAGASLDAEGFAEEDDPIKPFRPGIPV